MTVLQGRLLLTTTCCVTSNAAGCFVLLLQIVDVHLRQPLHLPLSAHGLQICLLHTFSRQISTQRPNPQTSHGHTGPLPVTLQMLQSSTGS